MFRWYVINTYSGHENKVKQNLEHRVHSMSQERNVRQVVVPTEQVSEMKDGQKETKEKRTMPGYVLVNMEMTDDAWGLVKNTPGVTGFVGSRNKPVALSKPEVDRLLHRETAERPRTRAQFSIGESVKVISGPLADFSGEIAEINEDAAKLKVLVSIFGRETPVEVGYDQVKKIRPGPAMAKKDLTQIKLQIPGRRRQPRAPGGSRPGPARGQHHGVLQGVQRPDPAGGPARSSRSRSPSTRTARSTSSPRHPPAAVLIKEATGLDKGSGEPHADKVGTITARPDPPDCRAQDARPQRQRPRRRQQDHRRYRPLDGRRVEGLD